MIATQCEWSTIYTTLRSMAHRAYCFIGALRSPYHHFSNSNSYHTLRSSWSSFWLVCYSSIVRRAIAPTLLQLHTLASSVSWKCNSLREIIIRSHATGGKNPAQRCPKWLPHMCVCVSTTSDTLSKNPAALETLRLQQWIIVRPACPWWRAARFIVTFLQARNGCVCY